MLKKVLTKKYKWKIIISVLILLLAISGLYVFKLLVKVRNVRYLYNYMVDTKGGLPVQYYPLNMTGADGVKAAAVSSTTPSEHQIQTSIRVNGIISERYNREEPIYFQTDYLKSFSELSGVFTFRGDYMRNLQSSGKVYITREKFIKDYWSVNTGKLLKSNGTDYWSGNGWTGQPLIVKWDDDTKKIMNLYKDSKNKEGLVEVIYPGMDGYIHFYDLDTGEPTRDAINVGMTFKGTASLHPDGIPLLVCGSGDAQTGVYGECISPRVYIYSLIDGSRLYEFGAADEAAPRVWHAYDSSPIFHAETDTLICPGENGVLYTLKLNTEYDKEAGTLSINPTELVDFLFTKESYDKDGRYGSECSASVWGNYLFIGDNGGTFFCLDMNTMDMVWAQDLLEDINSSPILEEDETGNKFIYVGTTLKFNKNNHSIGEASIYKLNAMTGEIIWKKPYEVHTVSGLAGGVLSTGVLGKGPIEDIVIYSISKTPSIDGGYLAAFNKNTGETIWEIELDMYSWSSSGIIYAANGKAYVIQGCQNGDLLLIDAENGKVLDKMNFGTGLEATPAIYNNKIVIGMRNEKIVCVEVE